MAHSVQTNLNKNFRQHSWWNIESNICKWIALRLFFASSNV